MEGTIWDALSLHSLFCFVKRRLYPKGRKDWIIWRFTMDTIRRHHHPSLISLRAQSPLRQWGWKVAERSKEVGE